MNTDFVHGDRAQPALVHGCRLPWLASPRAGVERRLLERIGGEVALATSIVRYAPDSRFDAHAHDMGEEFLVLQGTFSDEHGDYPVGTYVRNPPGSCHRPFSRDGCVIFVKLRQMDPGEMRHVVLLPHDMLWRAAETPRRQRALLYAGRGETVQMEVLEAGGAIPARSVAGGEEMFVIDGSVNLAGGEQALGPWGWRRNPHAEQPLVGSTAGARLWIKRGHLAAR